MIVKRGVQCAKEVGATSILYACTHYPLVHSLFLQASEEFSWDGQFINPAEFVALEVKKWKVTGDYRFTPYTSKDTAVFIKNIVKFL